jgi:ribonuclease HI
MINDFPILSTFTSTALFADDSAMWRSGNNLSIILFHLQADLDLVSSWCCKWGFQINISKTIGIVFSNKKTLGSPVLRLNGERIKFEKTVKFLGILYDERCTWKPHILSIAERANKCLNLMRALCGTHWGASKSNLLLIYRAKIRSVIDYSCVVVENASFSVLKLLDTIQYKALLIVTGGMRGTALSSLQAECGETSLNIRREAVLLKFIYRLRSNPSNSAASLLQDKPFFNLGTKLKSRYKEKLDVIIRMQNLPSNNMYVTHFPMTPCSNLSIDVHLTINSQLYDVGFDIQSYLMTYIPHTYCNSEMVFVDGSYTPDGKASFGIFIPGLQLSYSMRISNHLSAYTAEACAIQEAISIVNRLHIPSAVILSDALNVIKNIKINMSVMRPLLINEIYCALSKSPSNITLMWIPGHAGISCHDTAEDLAHSALDKEITYLVSPEKYEMNKLIEKYVFTLWSAEWINGKTGIVYKLHFPLTNDGFVSSLSPRQKEVKVGRLRLQCCKLNKYLHKINMHDTGLCSSCNVPETVDHFLLSCSKMTEMHQVLSNKCSVLKLPFSISNLLSITSLQDILYHFIRELVI